MRTISFGKTCHVQLHPTQRPYMELVQEQCAQMEIKKLDDAFFMADLGDIVKKYEKWMELLPRVEPFYAVKCNANAAVLRLLARLGTGFDCASKDEILRVLNIGVDASRIIYANPCKQNSFIRAAAEKNVDLMTFDNECELYKVKANYPTARLVLRILPPANFKVQCQLGNKFGCHPDEARELLMKAQELGLAVVGVSFHVGSGVKEAEAFSAAVSVAAQVFDIGQSLGFDFELLDIGGGFPGHPSTAITFEEIAAVLNESLNKYFPPKRNVRIIGEPGRYFVASAFNLNVMVTGKRAVRDHDGDDMKKRGAFMYYVNDGVYGSFNSLLYDHAELTFRPVNAPLNPMEFRTSMWGPTCDGLDQVLQDARLPELEVNEYINFPNMGAYTLCAGSTFNGMPRPGIIYHCTEAIWTSVFGGEVQEVVTPAISIPVNKSLPMLKAGHQVDNMDGLVLSVSPMVAMEEDECLN